MAGLIGLHIVIMVIIMMEEVTIIPEEAIPMDVFIIGLQTADQINITACQGEVHPTDHSIIPEPRVFLPITLAEPAVVEAPNRYIHAGPLIIHLPLEVIMYRAAEEVIIVHQALQGHTLQAIANPEHIAVRLITSRVQVLPDLMGHQDPMDLRLIPRQAVEAQGIVEVAVVVPMIEVQAVLQGHLGIQVEVQDLLEVLQEAHTQEVAPDLVAHLILAEEAPGHQDPHPLAPAQEVLLLLLLQEVPEGNKLVRNYQIILTHKLIL